MSGRLFKNSTNNSIVLASESPRRQSLLDSLGITFTTKAASIDETPYPEETPDTFADRMALVKTNKITSIYPMAWVIGADTVVSLKGKILGKPGSTKKSLEMLRQLNGVTHKVYTGLCIQCLERKTLFQHTSCTKVHFETSTDDVLQAYIKTGDPLDKAGSYGVQGLGSFLVQRIDGSCTGVIGLPMNVLVRNLLKYKAIEPA